MTKRRLGELLQAEGLLTETQLRAGLDEQRKSNLLLGEALVKLGFVSEEAIAHVIVQQFSLPFISALQCNIVPEVLNLFPERMYHEYQFIAVDKIGPVLLIVGAGLMNHDVLDELERLSGCRVCQYVSTWTDIRRALAKYAHELKRGQSNLSGLGEMLLDSKLSPLPHIPPPPASTAPAAPARPPAAPQPAKAAPPPAPPVAAPSPAPVVAASAVSDSAQAIQPPKPTSVTRPQPSRSAMGGVISSRPSALSGSRPPSAKSSQTLAPVPATPANPPPKAAPPAEPPKPGPGLLGLFKKG